MALPRHASANQLIEFLDRNDPQYSELPKHWHETAVGWTSSDVREIVRAARRNTFVESVGVVPREMESDEANAIASIVQSLPCIAEFHIEATEVNGGNPRGTETLDRLLYGIFHNRCIQLTRFSTVYSVGFEAMMDLSA